MDIALRKGTKVRIVMDPREGAPAKGKKGRLVEYEKISGWALFSESGDPISESLHLPDGYREWDYRNEDFPGVKCGVRTSKNPVFLLEDGTHAKGTECYWLPLNPEIQRRIHRNISELLEKAGRKAPTFEDFIVHARAYERMTPEEYRVMSDAQYAKI